MWQAVCINVWHETVFVHGDDFVSTSSGAELRWLEAALERKFEIKSKTIGHDVGDRTEVKILNRVISATQQGFRYEPNIRHAELVVSELGLENAKSAFQEVPVHQCASKLSGARPYGFTVCGKRMRKKDEQTHSW